MRSTLSHKNGYYYRRKKITEGVMGYLFMIPTIIGFTAFIVYPLVVSVYYAMTQWMGIGKPKFVGLDNFIYMFTVDPSFWRAIRATCLFVLMTVPTWLLLGLFLAVLLNKPLPGLKTFRTLYYVPVVLPSIASLALWKFIFNQDYGLANSLLRAFHLPTSQWLESETMALPSMSIVSLWGVGSTIVILLGGLQSVPVEMYEAAEIDGASGWRRFWNITIPMITPILFLQLITVIIIQFQQFNPPQVLTNYGVTGGGGGGPNFATYLLAYSIYDSAFNRQQFGYAMAQVWILFAIIMFLTVIVYKFSNRFVYYETESGVKEGK